MRFTTLFPPPPTPMTLMLTTFSTPVSIANAMSLPPAADCLRWQSYHRLTSTNTPASAPLRRFLSFSPWRAPARLRLKNQKALGNPSLAGAKQFCRAEMCPDKERPAGNTCRISKGLDAVWAYFCPSKPCLPLSTDGMKEAKQKKSTAIGGRAIYIAEGIRWKKARNKMGREGRECIDKRGICDKIRKNAERK